MADRPVIRNLGSLVADVRSELRDALRLCYEMGLRSREEEAVVRIENKIRNVLELLTGSRD